ncbi:riboflavin biosynthesis protein RibF [Butyrivibrio sp. MC2013]|uniref:riboflavin biosynthesis protein RibF n=1 Tax=Butyrivibrio sp. MC2013 TaxID=1280686 RepID=UPI00040A42BF|nr:riboflavin biosynthesis protein RibF [Butyrivibrio sp. MC2013]
MIIIENSSDFHIEGPCAVAIGKFDGIHKGHRKLLEDLLCQKRRGMKTVVFTFDPSPASFFAGREIASLSTKEEKRCWFEEYGIDVLIEFPLNEDTAATEPELFVRKYLKDNIGAAFIVAGRDISFGQGGKGDYRLLEKLCPELSIETDFIDKVEENGIEISSSLIREAITEGRMEEAAQYLGAYYTISGRVTHGRALGRTIGIPTINVIPPAGKLLPPNGVYYSRVRIGERVLRGMTNIGVKPTVTDEKSIVSETYLYDFSGDLYDKEAYISIMSFRRPEMRFKDIAELKERMSLDIESGRIFHHNRDRLEGIG